MSRLSIIFLVVLVGCGKAPKTSIPDLSAYTNIAIGTPVTITMRMEFSRGTQKSVRDLLADAATTQGFLVSITPEEVKIRQSTIDTQLVSFGKDIVKSIHTNAP